MSHLYSIPASYINDIQHKMDIGLLIVYRQTYYGSQAENIDDLRELFNKYQRGEKVSFQELSRLDPICKKIMDDIREYIENDFIENLNEESNGIKELKAKKENAWKVQRNRWKKNTTVRKKAYNVLEIIKNDRTEKEWQEKYKCYTLEEYTANLEYRSEKWAKNKDYFFKFPYFEFLTEKQKKSGLKYDIDRNILELLDKDQITNYYISKPEYLSNTPIYTEKKEQIKLSDDGEMKSVRDTGDNTKITYFAIPKETGVEDTISIRKTLDSVDNELIDFIMKNTKNLYTFARASFSLNELATKVLDWHGGSGVENVRKRLLNLVRPIYFSDGKTEINLTLFDSCIIKDGSVTLVPGTTLRESYIKNQLISVARRHYEELEHPLSKHLCYNLQRDRVGLFSFNQPLTKHYNLGYFNQIIQFRTNDNRYKSRVISSCLDEFVRKKFIVSSYEVTKKGFNVNFIPLTDSEWKDLKNTRKMDEITIIEADGIEIIDDSGRMIEKK